MHLSEIWIYPVKSLGGIRLKESQVEEEGLKYDRRWLIVDEKGTFLTQRVNAQMALLDVQLYEEGLLIAHRYQPERPILIPFQRNSDADMQVKIWKDFVTARTVCDEADAWLSEHLGKAVRIVEMTANTQRKQDPMYAHGESHVSFADDFPFLLISQASLDDLNSRLAEPVTMKRFRPNFVVAGTSPYAEDQWKNISIGDTSFEVTKPCERCIMVTIDNKTGIKGSEPLKTLAGYRKIDRNIFFGQNVIGLGTGTVREGDEVVLLSSKH
ncbi:MOSC domain-containing protein [Dyadobacter sp. CY326]|uniref:MOSC domain-containing protein n=1 Tax=Dyadobacter sp. CY326 TaxID=2907300 RepID=UPI001F1FA383|nr:MOSC N-terminal beta barrel domain-containing protein [Dyadobacter sp. CY326]MCE7064572.1 MOSC domain-containing protein [Dyadobacter sp. CY326]